jgi:hypothetical protein
MAHIIGKSGAWKDVVNSMASLGFEIQNVADISNILAEEKGKLIDVEKVTEKMLEEEEQNFSRKNKDLDESYQKAVDRNKKKIVQYENQIMTEIHQLQVPVSFFKKPKQKIQLARKKRRLKQLKQKSIDFFENLQNKRDTERKRLRSEHKAKVFDIEEKAGKIKFNIEMIQNLLASPELAGALAELQMIEFLGSLPDSYYVLNDVQLSLGRAMLFDDKWRRTAQIDTLVISPSSIFVIEVKNWSREFVQTHDYHNPYDQVEWATYLCHKQTGVLCRSIVAHTGNIPKKPEWSYAKVLLLRDVKNYILWFKDINLTPDKMDAIANWFVT